MKVAILGLGPQALVFLAIILAIVVAVAVGVGVLLAVLLRKKPSPPGGG